MRRIDHEILLKSTGMAFLVIFVFLPSFYLLGFMIAKWDEVYLEVFAHPLIGNKFWHEILRALSLSLRLALTTVLIDLVIGIPLAYMIVKSDIPGKSLIEDLTTLPLVIPTSGFGFATMLTWTASYGLSAIIGRRIGVDVIIPGIKIPALMLLVHVSLTFPYVVRTISGALRDVESSYEIISRSLGASSVTTFRRVTLPMIMPSILSGSVLAFARSLGETGATMIIAGVSTTAPIAIVKWEFENKLAPAAFLGALLVGMSLIIILPVEYLASRSTKLRSLVPLSLELRMTKLERRIPSKFRYLRDIFALLALTLVILAPIATLSLNVVLYWNHDPYTGRVENGVKYQLFGPSRYWDIILHSIKTSFIASTLATLISMYIAIISLPIITRSRIGHLIRTILKIPLVIPTSALGLSMILLWGPKGFKLINPGIWLIVFTHIVFSVPVIIETTIASYYESSVSTYEDTARSLGATLYDVYETITLPMTKRGILAGTLLAFTHSLGETGATFIVMGSDITVSTLIVNMVEALAIPAAMFASLLLILISLALLGIIRVATG
ncbi:MAG: hypothetical protein DRJ66_01575 [Thermoprotei archaeon]|nr:MAG: hypothetical protein DRJ66_01575 [Thermoprotei archaeon]RLF20847.1 MAG: hypothetical protein DRZ82_01035 [Thermoprotei archaeon]